MNSANRSKEILRPDGDAIVGASKIDRRVWQLLNDPNVPPVMCRGIYTINHQPLAAEAFPRRRHQPSTINHLDSPSRWHLYLNVIFAKRSLPRTF
jgi:hypothetical protein